MTLLIRGIQIVLTSLFRSRCVTPLELCEHSFRVLPIDLDVYRHMNNAKYLNYMEAARYGLQVRTGFFKNAIRRGWIGPIAQIHIQYLRPLRLFQKFRVTTQIIFIEEKWIWLLQRFMLKTPGGDREVARALVQSTIRSKNGNVPPSEYLPTLGYTLPSSFPRLDPDLEVWIEERGLDSRT